MKEFNKNVILFKIICLLKPVEYSVKKMNLIAETSRINNKMSKSQQFTIKTT